MPDLSDLFSGGSWISAAVALPFIVIALIFIVIAVAQRVRVAGAKRSWQTTSGRVLFSQVERRRSSSGSGGTSTSYYPRVVYEYAVNGNRYQGNRVTLGSGIGRGSYRYVQDKLESSYPPGQIVQVYYNPHNPQESALEMRAPSSGVFLIVVIVMIVILIITTTITAGGFGLAQSLIDSFTGR
jgi:hypothetical protein